MNRIVFCTFYNDYFFAEEHQATRVTGKKVGQVNHGEMRATCDHPINKRLVDAINRR